MTTEISTSLTSSTNKVKKTKKTSSEVSTPTPFPESASSEPVVVLSEPAVATKPKKSKLPSPVVESVISTEPVDTSIPEVSESEPLVTLEVTEESNTELLFNKLINQFQDIQSVMKTLHSNLKILQKEVSKERK